MRLLEENRSNLDRFIDPEYSPERSIVARYRNAFTFGAPEEDALFKETLLETSLREGARVFPLLTYRGVDIHILDESSFMHTGTLKSIDGCFTLAQCRRLSYERVVFESGGNTGTALTEYGQKAGLETFLFVPEENLPLLDSRVFEPERAHLISVAEPGWVKKAARSFVGLNGIRHIPEVGWRYQASMFRGFFILEHMLRNGSFDWLTQTISAAFGPIGIFSVLKGFLGEAAPVPRFLGFQQEANCPMYKAWKSTDKQLDTSPPDPSIGNALLTKVMYDVAPYTYGTYEDLKNVLTATRGDLTTVNHAEFFDLFDQDFDGRDILDLLNENGFNICARDGEIVDKTGLIALAGTLKEIRNKKIEKGTRVLCCLTSGAGSADGKAVPDYRVSNLEDLVSDCGRMIYGG
jgi:threonine synthase